MKRYENPIIDVSLFDTENVVATGSITPEPDPQNETAVRQALDAAGTAYGTNLIRVTF